MACAINIAAGGYEVRELVIAARCVLLDWSGCQRYWHTRGIPTELSVSQLLRVIERWHRRARLGTRRCRSARPYRYKSRAGRATYCNVVISRVVSVTPR